MYICIYIQWNTISAVAWRTFHEHIVGDVFCSKKTSSALLVDEKQASQRRCLLLNKGTVER